MSLLDPQTLRYIEANEAVARLLGSTGGSAQRFADGEISRASTGRTALYREGAGTIKSVLTKAAFASSGWSAALMEQSYHSTSWRRQSLSTDAPCFPLFIAIFPHRSSQKAKSVNSTHRLKSESPSVRSNSRDPKKSFGHCSRAPVRPFFYMTKMEFWRRIRVGCDFWAIPIWTMWLGNAPSSCRANSARRRARRGAGEKAPRRRAGPRECAIRMDGIALRRHSGTDGSGSYTHPARRPAAFSSVLQRYHSAQARRGRIAPERGAPARERGALQNSLLRKPLEHDDFAVK